MAIKKRNWTIVSKWYQNADTNSNSN